MKRTIGGIFILILGMGLFINQVDALTREAAYFEKLPDKNIIGPAEKIEPFFSDRSDYTHRQTGAGKRVAHSQGFRKAEFDDNGTNLIFEQFLERFDQFQAHAPGQTAHIVMGFNRRRRPSKRNRFD